MRRRQNFGRYDGFGDSVYQRAWPVLRDFGGAWDSTGTILTDFASGVIKMKGLAELLATSGEDGASTVQQRLRVLNMSKSTINAALVDADLEDYSRQSTPVSGLAELLREYLPRLSSACGGIPITRLFGMSPGGLNSTGEHDLKQWDDRVKALQEKKVIPLLEQITRLILRSLGKDPEETKWTIEARPLRNPTGLERAQERYQIAQTDKVYYDMQVLSEEDIADSRWGGDRYSAETKINWDEREKWKKELEAQEQSARESLVAEMQNLNNEQVPAPPNSEGAEPAGPPGEVDQDDADE